MKEWFLTQVKLYKRRIRGLECTRVEVKSLWIPECLVKSQCEITTYFLQMLSNDNIDKWQQEGTGFWFIYFQNGNCLGGSKIISHGRKHQTLLWLIAVGKNWVFNCWSRKHKHGLHNLQETEAVDLVICHTVSGSLYHNVEDIGYLELKDRQTDNKT